MILHFSQKLLLFSIHPPPKFNTIFYITPTNPNIHIINIINIINLSITFLLPTLLLINYVINNEPENDKLKNINDYFNPNSPIDIAYINDAVPVKNIIYPDTADATIGDAFSDNKVNTIMEPEPNPIRPCDNPAINPEKAILIKVNLLES